MKRKIQLKRWVIEMHHQKWTDSCKWFFFSWKKRKLENWILAKFLKFQENSKFEGLKIELFQLSGFDFNDTQLDGMERASSKTRKKTIFQQLKFICGFLTNFQTFAPIKQLMNTAKVKYFTKYDLLKLHRRKFTSSLILSARIDLFYF